MADRTAIEWTDATWTPIRARHRATGKVGWHCEHVSEGCRNVDVDVFLDDTMLLAPLRWKKPRRIFVCSMTDLFGDWVPDAMIDQVFAVMALAPQHTFQVLTKRPARMRAYCASLKTLGRLDDAIRTLRVYNRPVGPLPHLEPVARRWPLPNAWLGTSCEDQPTADERIPELLATPAAVRFASAEPLLGRIDFERLGTLESVRHAMPGVVQSCERRMQPRQISGVQIEALGGARQATIFYQTPDHMGGFSIEFPRPFPRLDWIVVGGESGSGARPMHRGWAREIRDQCSAAGVAFHFKQWGNWAFIGDLIDGGERFEHVGKRRAGRLLDGVEHNGMPASIGRAA